MVRGGNPALASRLRRAACGLILSVALLACAGGPVEVPPRETSPDTAEDVLTMPDGETLALSEWPASDGAARAVILAVHGFGDYGPSTYGDAAAYWRDRGITVYAYDQRGFGRNPSRGAWAGPDLMIEDLAAVADHIAALHPDTPLFVVGHSMGAGVTMAAAGEGRLPKAAGIVLAAPAIYGGDHLGLPYRSAAWLMAKTFPDERWSGDGLIEIIASDNTEMLRALGRDPHYLHRASAREIMGLVRIMDRAEAGATAVKTPVLMLHGKKDQLIPGKTVGKIFERLPGDNRFVRYKKGWHMLFRDLQAEKVWRDVADWVLDRSPKPAAAAG